jgi:N,N'-diacetylbacillosaminyl-diphospho-undecaprenol alpha-1,3-N-acetylgalactosaminyltransferase
MRTIIHFLHHAVSAKRFVEPLACRLSADGWHSEIWVESNAGPDEFLKGSSIKMRYAKYSLRGNALECVCGFFGLLAGLRRSKPVIIQAHQTRDALIPLLAGWILRIPIRIYHNHGLPFIGYTGTLRTLLRLIEWLNCRLATHVLTVSDAMREIMIAEKLTGAASCRVLGPGSACGIDLCEFNTVRNMQDKKDFKTALGIPRDEFVAIYVGRPHRRKGFDRTVHVWDSLHLSGSRLLLAGISEQDLSSVSRLHQSRIVPIGYVTDLRPYYAAADVVVLPSEHEGFGYSLLEGAALGCCLVASRIPGPDALVQDDENGYLIDSDEHFASVLQRLAADQALRYRLGGAAKKMAEKFNRIEILNLYSTYIDQIVCEEGIITAMPDAETNVGN